MSKNDIIKAMSKRETSEALKRAKAKYSKEKVEKITIELYPNDSDIKDRIADRVADGEPKATYIKRLIREDIKRGE